jgi:hypothetical protein
MKKRELALLFLLGGIFPIYPAVLIYEMRHGDISILRISMIGLTNAVFLPFFVNKGLDLKINFDIDRYLTANYSNDEQKNIIKNYSRYKSKFFRNTPLFTREALNKDANLWRYKKEALKTMFRLLFGGLCYFGILFLLFYFSVWV